MQRPAAPPDVCLLGSDTTAAPATLSVAVPDVAQFLERQVYETLLRFDCTGAPVPELARSWTSDDGEHRWSFQLRQGARFSDGTPVTAADVFAALGRDSLLLERAVVNLDGVDRVSVRFRTAFPSVPRVFADPALAVSRRAASVGWLVGSGVATADTSGAPATLTSLSPGGRPTITVRTTSGADGRDLLDHGIDLLVSGDPEVLNYASGRGELTTVPLPWNRSYVLVSMAPQTISDTIRVSLARDVVRTEARPAHGTFWWLAGPACPPVDTASSPPAPGSSASVVYYPRGDATARNLAERLVGLGVAGDGGRAAGIVPADFDALFFTGGASYLLPLPRDVLEPCRAVQELVARAPWLSSDPGRHITPLVETRERVIVRRGGSAFTVDWDGTLRLH